MQICHQSLNAYYHYTQYSNRNLLQEPLYSIILNTEGIEARNQKVKFKLLKPEPEGHSILAVISSRIIHFREQFLSVESNLNNFCYCIIIYNVNLYIL